MERGEIGAGRERGYIKRGKQKERESARQRDELQSERRGTEK